MTLGLLPPPLSCFTHPGAAAAPKCTTWQADVTKTNFELSSNKSWEALSKNGKARTPYTQFCFKFTAEARHAASKTCSEAGFGAEHCCVQAPAAVVTLPTGEPCSACMRAL